MPYIWAAIGGFLSCHVGMTKLSNPTEQMIDVTFPGGSITLDSSQPEIVYDKMLKDLFAKKFSKDGLMGWLADKDIFSFEDERLAKALTERLCASIPEQPLNLEIQAAQDCAEKPVAAHLRQLVTKRKVPFHYVGIDVKVGVPELKDQPDSGEASVCATSEFRDQRVELTNPRTHNRIEVQVSGRYTCTSYTTYPDI